MESEGENGKSVFCIQSQRRLVQANDAQKREKDGEECDFRRAARRARCGGDHDHRRGGLRADFELVERAITAINQVVKFVSILAGVTTAMHAGESGGAMRGACVGLLYMALGIVCYALMMGQSPQLAAYLADLGMGLAAGGLFGMILTTRKKG